MTIFINLVILLIGVFIGVMGYVKYNNWKAEKKKKQFEIENYNNIECAEYDMVALTKEWETTINTQMHFNDLIIKFRSVVLSVFIASLGFIYGFSKQTALSNGDYLLLMSLALAFWICSFLLDYFYYHKLLMGSVEHAKKFDENPFFKNKGLFGLSRRISFEIEPTIAKILIWAFYLIPIICVFAILIIKKLKII